VDSSDCQDISEFQIKKKGKQSNKQPKYMNIEVEDLENSQIAILRKHKVVELKPKSKWVKIKNMFEGLKRFRKQEAVVLNHPDQIIEEIKKTEKSQSKDLSLNCEDRNIRKNLFYLANKEAKLQKKTSKAELSET
jgi:uncharacterized protein (DUF608 family)